MASNALMLLGDNPINSFDEAGAGASAAKNLYPSVKKRALSFHPWTFALKEQELGQTPFEPDKRTGYKYAYQTPVDLIRLWAVLPWSVYQIIGPYIYSNQTGLLARYIYDVEESQFPAHMVKAMEYLLAAEFAISVTEEADKAQLFDAKGKAMLAEASTIDSQGRPQESIISSPMVEARMSGFGYGVGSR